MEEHNELARVPVVCHGALMNWLVWALLFAGLVAVFVLWDVVFCDGKRCEQIIDRVEQFWRR